MEARPAHADKVLANTGQSHEEALKHEREYGSLQRADAVGLWAGTLALAEVGVGSLLHGLHIPFAGTLLSLNQGLFLARITRLNRQLPRTGRLCFEVSSVTALIKSFAPVGKRLTPMLAIASQGLLFSIGVTIFGANIFGVIVGAMLLAVWGVAQPVILAGVMFSAISQAEQTKILSSWTKLISEVPFLNQFSVMQGVLIFLGLKCLLAASLAIIAWQAPTTGSGRGYWSRFLATSLANWESVINRRIHNITVKTSPTAAGREHWQTEMILAIKDLRSPLIWISIGTMAALYYFIDSDLTPIIWMSMRAIAGVYVFYLVLRLLPWDKLLNPENHNTRALRTALLVLKGKTPAESLAKTSRPATTE